MPTTLAAQKSFNIGEKLVVEAPSKKNSFVVAFEDDGETGYFYACDRNAPTFILDAMHIYNVESARREAPFQLDVVWSDDERVAALFIEKVAHGIFDFGRKRGYCRSNFPPATGEWATNGDHSWNDEALSLLI